MTVRADFEALAESALRYEILLGRLRQAHDAHLRTGDYGKLGMTAQDIYRQELRETTGEEGGSYANSSAV